MGSDPNSAGRTLIACAKLSMQCVAAARCIGQGRDFEKRAARRTLPNFFFGGFAHRLDFEAQALINAALNFNSVLASNPR